MSGTITLDGTHLTRTEVVAVARQGARVALDEAQLAAVRRACSGSCARRA
jgi:histidine ammonia-lyase